MAIFHLTTKLVCRSKGQSAVAKAAYNTRAKLANEHTGEQHDYTRKRGLLFTGMFVPPEAPAWAQERQALWSAVERHERRKNAQLARELEVALPHELTDQQRAWLVQDFVREQFLRRGLVADVAIHPPDGKGDARNYHAHILVPTRYMTPEGFGAKARDLNTKEQLAQWREKWAHLANRHLERHGHAARIDHRTLAAQGLDREPTLHLGPQVAAMEAKGLATDRGDQARAIAARNQERDALTRAAAQTAEAQRTATLPPQAPTLEARVPVVQARQEREKDASVTARLEAAREAPRDATPHDEPTLGQGLMGASHAAEQGIMVVSGLAGNVANKLADVVSHILDSFAGQPAPPKLRSSDMLKSAEARKAYSAQQRAAERRDAALDQISAQLKRGPQIEQAAVGALSYSDLQHIKDQGDDVLRALVRQREAEVLRYYSFGHTRERTRER